MNDTENNFLEIGYQSAHPMRTLIRLLAMTPRRWLIYSFVYLIKTSPVLLLPVYVEQMIALCTRPADFPAHYFWYWSIGYLLLVIGNIPGHMLFVRLTHTRIRSMEHRLRAALVRRLQQLSIAFHTRSESGRLQSKVLRDVEGITQLSMHFYHSLTSALLNIGVGVGIAFWRNPIVGLFFIGGAPIAAFLIHQFRRRMREHNHAYRTTVEGMSSRVSEMIDSIPVTRAHGVEETEIARADGYLNKVYRAGMDIDFTNHLFGCSSWTTMYGSMTLIIAATTYLAIHHGMPAEQIALYQGLFGLVVGSLAQLLGLLPLMATGVESLRSLGEVLECPDLEWNHGKRRLETVTGAIAFENLHFSYEDSRRPALDDFSLTITPGECVAFVGESGSGKSTLMGLTIGFWRPQAGRILLDGHDAATLDLRSWRRHIAVVPQHTILFSGSIRDNITYGLGSIEEARIQATVEAANLRRVLDELPEGLDTLIGENGMTLSGGQRQRVAIARALIRDPRIIILDEATSALDVISEREVQEAIDHLIVGRTTLIVAHRLSTIRRADRVVVMKNGRAIEVGSQQELTEHGGEFTRLKRLQA